MFDTVITNGSVWLRGRWEYKTLCVKNGVVDDITDACPAAKETFDARGRHILPGLIDSHVHLRPTGAINISCDDFHSGSVAAIRGGVTTVIDFTGEASGPDEVDAFFDRRLNDAKNSLVDFGFHSSYAKPENVPEMAKRSLAHGMPTVKMYTTYSFSSDDRQLLEMLKRSADRDIMLNCHAENDYLVDPELNDIELFSARRPELCELSEVAKLAEMTAYTGGLFYLVHVSCGDTVAMLEKRFSDLLGFSFILESCPHYFTFNDSVYRSPDARLFTMTPPLRSAVQRETLIKNFDSVSTLSTDHCPFHRAQKNGAPDELPTGIGGLGYAFAQMYRLFGDSVIDRFTVNQAKVHGIQSKGEIAPGLDADIAVFEKTPPAPVTDLRGACDYSVYSGCEETVRFTHVMRRGEWMMRDGIINESAGNGRYLYRSLANS